MNNFKYRKTLSLTSASEVTDYQVKLVINRSSGTDSGFTVYVGSACASDYSDIAFTDDHGNDCPYWIESSSSSTATVWVKVPVIHTSGTSLVFYYGGAMAMVSLSNGEKTFPFFEEFYGSALNSSKWTTSGGGQSVTGGYLSITQSSGEHRFAYTLSNVFVPNTVCRIRGSQDGVSTSIQDGYGGLSFTRIEGTNQFQAFTYKTGEQRTNLGTGYTGTHTFEQIRNGATSVIFKIDETTVATHTSQVPTADLPIRCIAYQSSAAQTLYVHWILVRKYASSEPAAGTWGSEESLSPTYGTTTGTWLNGFAKRKKLDLTSATALTDYQVTMNLYRSSGTDTAGNFYLGASGCQSDYRDIRFTTASGATCPYWIESYDASVAKVWVKVPSIATSGTSIYVYYGNSAAVSESNGEKVFEFFDDFDGSTLKSQWTNTVPIVSIANSECTITHNADSYAGITTAYNHTPDMAVRTKFKSAHFGTAPSGAHKEWYVLDDVSVDASDRIFIWCYNDAGYTAQYQTYNGGVVEGTNITNWSANTFYTMDILRNGSTSVIFKKDGSTVATHTTRVPEETMHGQFLLYSSGMSMTIAWYLHRKYTATEPTLAGNAEESTPTFSSFRITTHVPEWLNGWTKRKVITITNPASLAGYQHSVTVAYDSDMQADFDDIRFTDVNGNECPYWIESKTDSTSANVWIRVPVANTSQLYLYYGNSGAVSASNGDRVFEFFDGFEGTSLNAVKWGSPGSGTITVANSEMTWSMSGTAYDNSLTATASVSGDGYAIMSRCKYTTTYASSGNNGISMKVNTNAKNHAVIFDTGNIIALSETSIVAGTTVSASVSPNTYYILEGTTVGNTVYGRVDHGSWVSWSRTALSGGFGLHMYNASGSTRTGVWDWVAVRKYQATEPSLSVGSETSAPTYTPVHLPQFGGNQI